MWSRASIYLEIRAGRGIDGKDYVYLDVRPETSTSISRKTASEPGRDTAAHHSRGYSPQAARHLRLLPHVPGR